MTLDIWIYGYESEFLRFFCQKFIQPSPIKFAPNQLQSYRVKPPHHTCCCRKLKLRSTFHWRHHPTRQSHPNPIGSAQPCESEDKGNPWDEKTTENNHTFKDIEVLWGLPWAHGVVNIIKYTLHLETNLIYFMIGDSKIYFLNKKGIYYLEFLFFSASPAGLGYSDSVLRIKERLGYFFWRFYTQTCLSLTSRRSTTQA